MLRELTAEMRGGCVILQAEHHSFFTEPKKGWLQKSPLLNFYVSYFTDQSNLLDKLSGPEGRMRRHGVPFAFMCDAVLVLVLLLFNTLELLRLQLSLIVQDSTL